MPGTHLQYGTTQCPAIEGKAVFTDLSINKASVGQAGCMLLRPRYPPRLVLRYRRPDFRDYSATRCRGTDRGYGATGLECTARGCAGLHATVHRTPVQVWAPERNLCVAA
eukprot:1796237-Rhodomonas_salina.1